MTSESICLSADFGVVTLRQLANHQWLRSVKFVGNGRLEVECITKNTYSNLSAIKKDLNFDPGDEYVYCNTGFTLLAEVVARLSGMSFAEFTDLEIFKPLDMNTLFYDDHEKIVPNRAYSYKIDSLSYKSQCSACQCGSDKPFTVEDLSQWVMVQTREWR